MKTFDQIYQELMQYGFLTGSRAFGTHNKASDWDIIYSVTDTEYIDSILEGINRQTSTYFTGYKIGVGGQELNLIPVHPADFLPWYFTTRVMKATYPQIHRTGSGSDPCVKYALFQSLLGAFKTILPPALTANQLQLYKKIWGL